MQELSTIAVAILGAGDLPMVEKLRFVVPEVILFSAACIVMVMGLSPVRAIRRRCGLVSILALIGAGIAALTTTPEATRSALPHLAPFIKSLVAAVGILLVLLLSGTVDRDYERALSRGVRFDAIRATRGEFYSFALFSLMGLMLCSTADDLIWLFLALELTSLPTYVMVSISTSTSRSQESGIKYFILGALSAATFLYGFTFLYGATGTTLLFGDAQTPGIAGVLADRVTATGSIGFLATLGIVLSLVGVSFKIAAVPMHFYTPDVYEGASAGVGGFLAFAPKAAGIVTMILLLSVVGWRFGPGGTGESLPQEIRVTLWVMAALTMTVGNVLALLQRSVKRILAYSSIAHSGYMLVGIIVGPGQGTITTSGLAASLFYLLCYGFMNVGAFAALASLERSRRGSHEEPETVDDLRGLCAAHPIPGWMMVLTSLSLLGLPPLLGFFGKLLLFTSAITAGEILLVVILGLNSAVAAFFYLRLAAAPLLESAPAGASPVLATPFGGRVLAGVLSAASVVVLVPPAAWLMTQSRRAGEFRTVTHRASVEDASRAPIGRAGDDSSP